MRQTAFDVTLIGLRDMAAFLSERGMMDRKPIQVAEISRPISA
jgi:hypothetical protein